MCMMFVGASMAELSQQGRLNSFSWILCSTVQTFLSCCPPVSQNYIKLRCHSVLQTQHHLKTQELYSWKHRKNKALVLRWMDWRPNKLCSASMTCSVSFSMGMQTSEDSCAVCKRWQTAVHCTEATPIAKKTISECFFGQVTYLIGLQCQ